VWFVLIDDSWLIETYRLYDMFESNTRASA